MNYLVFPHVTRLVYHDGPSFRLPDRVSVQIPPEYTRTKQEIERLPGLDPGQVSFEESGGIIRFEIQSDLAAEEYRLQIDDAITITARSERGSFYGIKTLKQILLQANGALRRLTIHDKPDLVLRGVMHDIGRDKIPTVETVFQLLDLLSDFKINHFQFHMQNFPFAYTKYRQLWEKEWDPLTAEDMQAISRYARERFIDFVPNQNSLGHMDMWLEKDKLNHLAECPDGFDHILFDNWNPGTLDPSDPGSLMLLQDLYDELLPNYSSELFNINFDEPFELGLGKSKALCEHVGVGQVYVDFLLQVQDYVSRQHHKRIMMWGDIIRDHADQLARLPQEILFTEWGYEAQYDFAPMDKKFADHGFSFVNAPGTSTWNSFLGRTENMIRNITQAALSAKRYQGLGLLTTDWGDNGHPQYLPVSYPAFVFGAAMAWRVEPSQQADIARAINQFVLFDEADLIGDILLDLGRYLAFEGRYVPNKTVLFELFIQPYMRQKTGAAGDRELEWLFNFIEKQGNDAFDYPKLAEHIDQCVAKLEQTRLNHRDASLVLAELTNSARLVKALAQLYALAPLTDRRAQLADIRSQLQAVAEQHGRVWRQRNKAAGLDYSLRYFAALFDTLEG